ncbi:hypothetical protein A2U01_0015762 [Trifolium medium]|uniref:Uncharacterized protein n=1 Tax=Trifolium medium TaxID=97028 RepID=A0A392N6L9_9FABA|nr:hypothetical protein [Trifolium medium]
MSIIIRAVFMKGLPKINGTSSSSSISITTKSIGNINLSTLTSTSSAIPDGRVMDLSANYNVILLSGQFEFPGFSTPHHCFSGKLGFPDGTVAIIAAVVGSVAAAFP